MTEDIDIYRSAAVLMHQHGEDTRIHAAMRADELMEKGDMEGRAVWLRVIAAIKERGAWRRSVNHPLRFPLLQLRDLANTVTEETPCRKLGVYSP